MVTMPTYLSRGIFNRRIYSNNRIRTRQIMMSVLKLIAPLQKFLLINSPNPGLMFLSEYSSIINTYKHTNANTKLKMQIYLVETENYSSPKI